MTTIGERLEDARKKKGISIREAAEATKIRGDYLQKFEGNQFDIGLTEIYVRGFLKSYAHFLKIPSDRIISDYMSLGRGDSRKQPSREIYGKMDLSISGADEPTERNTANPQPTAAEGPTRRTFSPSRGNLPRGLPIDPAAFYRYGKFAVAALVLGGIVWACVAIFGGKSQPATPRSQPSTSAPAQQTASSGPDLTGPDLGLNKVTIIANADVKVRVSHFPDDNPVYFYQWMKAGDRHDFENQPMFLSASAMENVKVEYKGQTHDTGQTGTKSVKIDFTKY
jgi:cytoskeleton protein RodZ